MRITSKRTRRSAVALLIGVLLCCSAKGAIAQEPRDPFAPLISKNGLILIPKEFDRSGMSLRGIIYSDGDSLAVIGDEILGVGDAIGEYEIVAIGEKTVRLIKKDGGEGFTLKLEEEE